MNEWDEEESIAAAYLNPALSSFVLAHAANAYALKREEGMDWMLSFVLVPLVFHRPTRKNLPRDSRTHLGSWVWGNPGLVARFPDRMAAMAPVVRSGLRFGLRHGLLELENGFITAPKPHKQTNLADFEKAAVQAARLLVKTLETSTVYALMGVRKVPNAN